MGGHCLFWQGDGQTCQNRISGQEEIYLECSNPKKRKGAMKNEPMIAQIHEEHMWVDPRSVSSMPDLAKLSTTSQRPLKGIPFRKKNHWISCRSASRGCYLFCTQIDHVHWALHIWRSSVKQGSLIFIYIWAPVPQSWVLWLPLQYALCPTSMLGRVAPIESRPEADWLSGPDGLVYPLIRLCNQ